MTGMRGQFEGYTIVFDLDGTLVNTAPDLLEALNHVLTRAKFAPVTLEAIATMIGHGARAMIVKGMENQGYSPAGEELNQYFADFLEYYAAHISDHSHPFEGVEAALDTLAEQGAVLAVCTNKKQHLSDQLLTALGLAERFQAIVGADSVPASKPDGDHILRAVKAAGGRTDRAIMVGDSRTDERAARNAGLPFVFVPFGYEEETPDQIGPDVVVDHYSDLVSALSDLIG
ncbi:phosphoglycolate phosphatase [Hyphomonas beringensis]|nr:phosphoglycolate phosphatase [Hyphomonas beringensis]